MISVKKKYEPLFTGTTRYYIVTGGRGSGKSFGVSVLPCLLLHGNREGVLYTRYTLTSAYISIIPEFIEKLKLLNLTANVNVTKTDISNVRTGSRIMFRGIKTSSGDQTANLKSLQGINTWIVDEAEELTDEVIFDRIDLSLRQLDKVNKVVLVMNPATKEHWIYKRFFEDAGVTEGFNGVKGDVTYIHTTYLDNIENLSASFLNQVERIRVTNPKKYEHVILGGWLDKAEGVIFTNWEYGEFDHSLQFIFGQDYGFSIDPTTLIRVAVDENKKIIYAHEECYKAGMGTSEIIEMNKRVCGNHPIIADGAEDRLVDEIRRSRLNIHKADKTAGSVKAGLKAMSDYKIIVTPSSINIGKELNNYSWANKADEFPVDKWNHAIDSIRYAAMWLRRQSQGGFSVKSFG
jgi:phage terminase large subunit